MQLSMPFWRSILARLAGQSFGGARNLYEAFGYHREISIEHLFAAYHRGGIASRIVRAFPKATWRDAPVIRDEKGDSAQKTGKTGKANENHSPFVEAVEDFFETKHVYQYLERVDRLAGVGEFAILVMGFAGGEDMATPLGAGTRPLLFLQPYGQLNITIAQWETNRASERYGLPVLYSVKQAKPLSGGGGSQTTFTVHHSRVLHAAEHLDDNEVFGLPRLYPIMNYLMDLEKTVGAGGETYWQNSRQGTAYVADKDAQLDDKAREGMKEQIDEFEHSLRRYMTLQGVTPHVLNAEYHDPGPYLEKLLDLIAGAVGIPKRILIGSERGELSSEQDENNWAGSIDERRNSFAAPMMLRPFVETMIATGNLPKPEGEFWVEWPSAGALSPDKAATVAKTKAEALATYSNAPHAQMIVPPQEFRTDFLDMTPETEYELPEEPEPIDENDPEARAQFEGGKRPPASDDE